MYAPSFTKEAIVMDKKKKVIIIAVAAAILAILGGIIVALSCNRYYLELDVKKGPVVLEYGVDRLSDVTARYKGTVFNRKGIPVKTTVKGDYNLRKLGTYEVTFFAEYKGISLKEKRELRIVDTTPPEIKLISSGTYYTSPSVPYVEEGYLAKDNYDGDVTSQVVSEEKDGVVLYTVKDSSGNTATVKRKINYKDVVAPVITLNQGNSISLNKGKDFVDPGFTAVDDSEGDLTSAVTVEGSVDGHKYGTYTLTYRVADSSGNKCEVTRTVRIADISAPVISLKGETKSYIKVGTAYTEAGYTASDNMDGDLTGKVSVSGAVDTGRMGIYSITYSVSDAFGNTGSATRKIYVYQKQLVSNPVNPGNKVVYLTFDDGPSVHTARLLDILDKYGVKATFFVTNQFPAYEHMIGETYRRGHTIALHTYKHVYRDVYASEAAYYHDLEMIKNIVVRQTGVAPTIVRFPGGTSNTVSRNYCRGIMSSLVESIGYYGYMYCDWNVSSGDAGGAKTSAVVASNVINGIKRHNVSVSLQHDITSYSVEAVEEILFWGIQNGYTFLPMSETTPMVHFAPQN